MRFGSPHWLWLLPFLAAGLGFLLWEIRQRRKRLSLFAAPSVWKVIVPELSWVALRRKVILSALALMLGVVALARPQWGRHEETVQVTGLDVMIALDLSSSMEVEDVVPSRLKKAKHLVRTLLDRLDGDRVGVVAFAGSTYVACPLTTDLDYAYETIDVMTPKMVVNQGTDVGLALETAVKALERGAEEPGKRESMPTQSKVVILISDGEDHEKHLEDGARLIKEAGAKLYVFGVGTQKGGPIPLRDDRGQLEGYKKSGGSPVISSFDPDALTRLASLAGGRYWNVTVGEAEVDDLLQDMGALSRGDYAERKVVTYQDRYQWPLALALILLLVEISLPARRILPLLLVGMFFLATSGARADGGASRGQVPLNAYLENKRGLKAFKEGKLEEAKKSFGSAQALDPTRPELSFNEGVIQAEEGNLEKAAQGFAQAGKGALEIGNPKLAARSFFNQGAVLSKKGDLGAAVRSYVDAIDAAVQGRDAETERDARKNLELLLQEQEKQKQQQQQQQQQQQDQQKQDQQQKNQQDQQDQQDQKDQQQKNQNQQSGDDQKKDQQKKPDEGNQEKQQPPQGQSSARKREFRSSKLSKEDAERVMAELSNRERELQAKLKKQRGRPQGQSRDW